MTKSNEILEALKMQPLTEEEKASRHILGRWYGPIATSKESTRNGRLYNRELWEKALSDELFHEKIANKCLFLELGHPIDREETDMSKVCACIPEMPKIIDGDLCAGVDILDTPNGKILKTLCDYGFVPGISSRGSGDVLPNDEVDPETFFLECWDIVAIPALKKARLSMCESLDSNTVKLKKALTESISKASEEDKLIMKETLENLDIDIEASEDSQKKQLTADDIPWDPEAQEVLNEEADNETSEDVAEDSFETAEKVESEDEDVSEENEEETSENAPAEEAPEETEDSEGSKIDINDFEEYNVSEVATVGDTVELLQEFDDDVEIKFEGVTPDGETFSVQEINSYEDTDEIIISMNGCDSEEDKKPSENTDSDIEAQIADEEISDEESEETEDESDSADDDGDAEVIESLKDMIRQKEALETELSELRKAKSVGDAEEQELQEKLTRYRNAFRTTSAEAAKVPELQSKVKELTEQLAQNSITIKTLTEQVNKAQQLKESVGDTSKIKINQLNEQISVLTKKSEALEAKLEGQTKQYTSKLQERTNLAKAYKARFLETLTKYVESKASMLGVKPSEITSRLNENYTLKDVDAVCDRILETTVDFGRLPFGGRSKTSARINEALSTKKSANDWYDDLSDLYELAGLNK